jgi:hypothetical protein
VGLGPRREDRFGRRDVRDLILEQRERGTTVLFSSHILPDVETLCDRVAIIREGKLVAVEEINSLKDLLFRLPELTGREWAMLEIYIEAPVGEAERQRLVEQLLDQLRTSSDKALAMRALDELANADGMVTEQERTVVEVIRSEIEQVGVGIFGQIGKMVSGSIARRQQALLLRDERLPLLRLEQRTWFLMQHPGQATAAQNLAQQDRQAPLDTRKIAQVGGDDRSGQRLGQRRRDAEIRVLKRLQRTNSDPKNIEKALALDAFGDQRRFVPGMLEQDAIQGGLGPGDETVLEGLAALLGPQLSMQGREATAPTELVIEEPGLGTMCLGL